MVVIPKETIIPETKFVNNFGLIRLILLFYCLRVVNE